MPALATARPRRVFLLGRQTSAFFLRPLLSLCLCATTPTLFAQDRYDKHDHSEVNIAKSQSFVELAMLPDAPESQLSASISGVVSATNGTLIAEAQVNLIAADGKVERSIQSNLNGEFSFTALPAGSFTVAVQAPGLAPFSSSVITLLPNQKYQLPQIVLAVAGTVTEVRVTVSQIELATEQVKAAEEQRAFGVLPNFYSSYIWDAAPLNAKQKFGLAFHSIADPIALLGTGFIAGTEQAADTFPGYGQGAAGYARRYGAAYGDDAIGRILASAALPALFHQDPRYFYKGTGTKRSRFFYAVSRTVITRSDKGKSQINYSHILGTLAAGGISNAYHPDDNRGLGLTFRNELIDTAGNAANNLVREFLLRRVTPKVPDYEKGQKSVAQPPTP